MTGTLAATGAPPRPVAHAVTLLRAMTVIALVSAALDFTAAALVGGTHLVAAVSTVVFAGLYLFLATHVARGRQWARVVTWVVGGLSVLSGLTYLLGAAAVGTTDGGEAPPTWLAGLGAVFGIVSVVVLAAIVVLLALPAAHPHFRPARGGQRAR